MDLVIPLVTLAFLVVTLDRHPIGTWALLKLVTLVAPLGWAWLLLR